MSDSLLPKPTIAVTPDGYRVLWEEHGIIADAEWVEQSGRELTCELTVTSTRAMSQGLLLASASFNLSAPQTRKNIARNLRDRDPDLDWDGMVEQLVVGVRERHRAGEPTIDMRAHVPSGLPLWHVHPFLETGGPTVLFGDGGTGKTTMAMAIALTAASGTPVLGSLRGPSAPVLFLDYEGRADGFHARLAALCEGAIIPMPAVHYRREYASLQEASRAVRREIERLGVGTVVVDSVGLACGGSPEAADVTLAFFRAVDSLRVPCLLVDHVTKNGGDDQTKAYGSVYKHNRPRLAWKLVGKDDDGRRIVGMSEHKHNDMAQLPRLAYRVSYATDENDHPTKIEIGWADPGSDPDIADRLLRGWSRLEAALRAGGLTPMELSSETSQTLPTVERTLRRYNGTRFTLREGKWWNMERAH